MARPSGNEMAPRRLPDPTLLAKPEGGLLRLIKRLQAQARKAART